MNPAFRRCLCTGLLWIGVGTGGVAADATKPPAPAAADPAKTHVLFMGADLSVQQGKKFYPVEDVDGSEFVIHLKGEKKFIRTRMSTNNLKIQNELKLSPLSVTLDELEGGPGYTPANDPRLKFQARSGAAGGAEAARQLAYSHVETLTEDLEKLKGAMVRMPEREKEVEGMLRNEQTNLDMTNQQTGSDYVSVGGMAHKMELELAEGNFDLVDISFKISSPVPLDDPYMVVLVEFSERGAKAGQTSLLIHAKGLDPIGAKPKYVRIREGGMPVGFKFLRQEVHIYNRGKEVATNASSKRVALSREEAHQYLLLEHLAANKNATVPPTAVAGSLPPTVRQRLAPDQLERVCFVRVTKDGALVGVYVDEGASLPLPDTQITGALAETLFQPALANGKPVEGVARVRLADLLL